MVVGGTIQSRKRFGGAVSGICGMLAAVEGAIRQGDKKNGRRSVLTEEAWGIHQCSKMWWVLCGMQVGAADDDDSRGSG